MFRSKKKKHADAGLIANQGQQLILPEHLEVKKDLGEGQYGVVQLGLWNPQSGTNPKYVAIKSLKNTAFDGVLKSVLEEALTMQKLSHSNIVKMYGISLPFKDEPLKLVTEYAAYGSLEDNLLKREKDVCRVSSLSKFAVQVAEGMNYLASQNLVHRDLSTRNILVFEPNLVKISDFGLARTLEGGAATQITIHRKLAVAWLPPEAIRNNIFTLQSDVWSYGITLWEMFSFGEKPWGELTLPMIKRMISNEPTNHLGKPDACPDGFYEVMSGCWETDPMARPTFAYISKEVSQLQPKEGITKVSHNTNEKGHLSYNCKVKVTVISKKKENGMLFVQSEDGSIGLVHEKKLDFSKKAVQKRLSGTNPGHISRPFEIKKQNSKELLTKLNSKGAAASSSTTANKTNVEVVRKQTEENVLVSNLLDLENDTTSDPTNPLNPERYAGNTATDHNQIQQLATGNQAYERLQVRGTTGHQTNEQLAPQGTTGNQAGVVPQSTTGNLVTAQNLGYMSMGYGGADGAMCSEENYTSMDYQQRNAATNDSDSAALKDIAGPSPHVQRLSRTQSESDVAGLGSDPDYAVPYQLRNGSKDDASLELGSNRTLGGNKPLSDVPRKKSPPHIPDRLDLQEKKFIATGGAGSSATTPRQRRPVPTPRKNRPSSASVLDTKTNSGKELPSGNEDFPTRSNSQSIACPDTQSVASTSANKKVAPPMPLPYQSTKRSTEGQESIESAPVGSEVQAEEQNSNQGQLPVEVPDQTSQADSTSEQPRQSKHYIIIRPPIPNGAGTVQSFTFQDPHGQEIPSESQGPLSPVEQVVGVTNDNGSSQLIQDRHYENADEVKRLSVDLIDLSANPEGGAVINEPIYDEPIKLPAPPEIPPEVINQPPPLPEKLFSGTLGRDLSPVGGWVFNPAFQPVNSASQPVNPAFQPVSPASQPVNPAFQPVSPTSQPVNPVEQPVNSVSQALNPGSVTNEGAYGEEIDSGIREILQICGEEVLRDWCYAALLQYQGDIEQVVRIIKTQKLSKLTGKTEQFCERTLTHCSWDLDRAAIYIFENFEDKDV